jgi:hypothetical protein
MPNDEITAFVAHHVLVLKHFQKWLTPRLIARGEIADAAGLPPDLAYAIRRTGSVVTDSNKDLLDSAQTAAWNDALAEYQMLMIV